MDVLRIAGRSSSSSGSYAGGSLDTQTVTAGASGLAANGNRQRGFVAGSLGAVADGTSNLYGGAAIRDLLSSEAGIGDGFDVVLEIAGVQANSGWASMNVGGNNVFTRAFATFSTAGGNSRWTWIGGGNLFAGTVVVGFD
jgi:hypothetical protein